MASASDKPATESVLAHTGQNESSRPRSVSTSLLKVCSPSPYCASQSVSDTISAPGVSLAAFKIPAQKGSTDLKKAAEAFR
eukprot:CAMPEP_0182604800 /NCGR_PEP_ID=MMETSP1324-20130603/93176_1 /TAXON_ID=236786 /ORGANISM="Florenciella sp., Strain RCC1587" /LENGTH=80 /DNA_ID=CAMNT_0024822733 /DNA_START=1908 /DNA_END=2147 /DNA_ORIENTATION=-